MKCIISHFMSGATTTSNINSNNINYINSNSRIINNNESNYNIRITSINSERRALESKTVTVLNHEAASNI